MTSSSLIYSLHKWNCFLILLTGEENEQEHADNGLFVPTTDQIDWCPICLNLFVEQEVAVPENCSHVFCLRCILTWAEVS